MGDEASVGYHGSHEHKAIESFPALYRGPAIIARPGLGTMAGYGCARAKG